MKIYVDKYELVTIEHEGKFAVIDPHEDFTLPVFETDVAEAEYLPFPDLEDDGDVLVYESKEPKKVPVKYAGAVIGEGTYDEQAGTLSVKITDKSVLEYLGLNHPANGVSVSL